MFCLDYGGICCASSKRISRVNSREKTKKPQREAELTLSGEGATSPSAPLGIRMRRV